MLPTKDVVVREVPLARASCKPHGARNRYAYVYKYKYKPVPKGKGSDAKPSPNKDAQETQNVWVAGNRYA